jgi:RHS repeat-associated protein
VSSKVRKQVQLVSSRLTRLVPPLLVLGMVLLLAACSGKTTGTTNITRYSATLNSVGSCGSESCRWYWEWWPASGPRTASTKSQIYGPLNGPFDNANVPQNVGGLTSGTQYRWVFCGSGSNSGGGGYYCAGPNGTPGGPTDDPPYDSDTFTTLGAPGGYGLAWGYNAAGQLGNGSTTNSTVPVPASLPSGTTITAIAGGNLFSLALTSTGSLLAWGTNYQGQLGNGITDYSAVPVPVILPSGTTITAIASGSYHSLALTSTGTVLAWGYNGHGELGNGTPTTSGCFCITTPGPVSIPSNTTITAVAAGGSNSLALTSTGTVLAWGNNAHGELGNGTIATSGCYCISTPGLVSVPGNTTITAVAAGVSNSLARTSTGTVLAWGYNGRGELGNGSTTDSNVPVPVSVPTNITITAVAAGGHSLALTSTGTVLAWGPNDSGQLGNGTTSTSGCQCISTPGPVSVPSNMTINAVAAGGNHSLAVTSTGSVLAWGYNAFGQLGNGSTTDSALPWVSLPPGTHTTAVFAASNHSLAIVNGPVGGPLSYSDLIGGSNASCDSGCSGEPLWRHQVGRPVDSYNGAFSHAFSDFSVPGHGRSLALSRSYYAYPDDPTSPGHKTVPNGPFGYGWTFNYNVSLAVTGTSPYQIATLTQETGATTVFKQPASGNTWAPAAPRTIATLIRNGDGTWTLTRHATDILNFNPSGKLTSLTDLNNYLTTLSYNGSNQLTDVTDPESRVLHFVWNGTGGGAEISSATILYNTSAARTESFLYDGSGNLQTVTDVGNGQWTFGYDTNHRMTTMQNPRLNTVTNHYDSNNRVDWQEDELSRRTCFDYTSIPGGTKITDPSGVNACGGSVRVDYYTFGMLSNVTKGYGTSDAATWSYGHDQNTLGQTSTVDPLNHTSYTSYDTSGNVLNATDPLGRTTINTYNAQNQILTSKDPSTVTTTYSYDATGINLASVSRPLTSTGQTATTSYAYANTGGCSAGDITSMTDADTKVWSYTCNTHGYHTTTKDPLGNVAGAVYDQNGWLTASFTPKAGCTTAQTPPTGCSTTYKTQNDHDLFGRVTTVTDPLSHTTVRHYDANGNLDRFTDGVASTTYTGYSSADEPCWNGVFSSAPSWSGTKCTDAPPSGFHRQTTYNADASVATEIDGRGKNTVAYTYDNQKRVKTFADAVHAVQTYAYNGDGTVATLTDNQSIGRVTTNSYDAGAQLTGVSYSDGSTPNISSIGYNPLGQRTSLVDNISGGQTSTWAYDSLGRLTTYTPGSSTASPLNYGYDLKGQQTSVTYPGQPTPVARTFDAAGRMATVQDWASHTTVFGYDANSNLTTETLPNATDGSSMQDTFAFDAADRLLNPTANQPTITYAKAGTSYGGFTYARDNANRLTNESATGMPGTQLGSVNYTTLSQVQNVQGAAAYAYDAADNPTSVAGGTRQTYDDANQLCWRYTSANACGGGAPATGSSTQFTYDTRGNRAAAVPYSGGSAQTATCYAYDQQSRMTQVSTGTGSTCTTPTTTATYKYDGSGVRTSKTVGATTTNFLWDPSGRMPMLLREVAGSATTSYIYGPGGTPLEQISGSTFLYYHQDQLGSTRAITDAAGAVKATYTYDAYGGVSACTGTTVTVNGSNICTGTISVSNQLRYAGQYTDAESGLIYLRARIYDPTTGQFLSRDPAVAMTRQPYGYVGGDPVNGVDPSGLWGYQRDWDIGATKEGGFDPAVVGSPQRVMAYLQAHASEIFPFSIGGCNQIYREENCALDFGPFPGPVKATACDATSFTFTARQGHYDLPGSTIKFSTYEQDGNVYLRQEATWVINNPLDLAKALPSVPVAWALWKLMADNLRAAVAQRYR